MFLNWFVYLLRTTVYQRKKTVRILKSNVYYVIEGLLLYIFNCWSSYVSLTDDWPFTKQGWTDWINSICLQVLSIKKKREKGTCSGGCNPVKWLNQTRRNLTIEFEFCNHTKINTVAFIFCRKGFYYLRLAHSRFARVYHVQAFLIPIFCSISFPI